MNTKFDFLTEINGCFCWDGQYPKWNSQSLLARWNLIEPRFREALEREYQDWLWVQEQNQDEDDSTNAEFWSLLE